MSLHKFFTVKDDQELNPKDVVNSSETDFNIERHYKWSRVP